MIWGRSQEFKFSHIVLMNPGLKKEKSEAVQNAVCSVGQSHQSLHHVPQVFSQTAFCDGPRDLHLGHLQSNTNKGMSQMFNHVSWLRKELK